MGCAFKRWGLVQQRLGTWFRWALQFYPLWGLIWFLQLGISNIRDGILFDKDQIRVKTVAFELAYRLAFYPAKELKRFNQFLQKELGGTHRPLSIGEKKKKRQGNQKFWFILDKATYLERLGMQIFVIREGHFLRKRSLFRAVYLTIRWLLFKWIRNHTSNYVKRESKDAAWLQPIPYRRRESGREAFS